jgi:gamma-glutamyltranspeptidase/glutathione hydrolase
MQPDRRELLKLAACTCLGTALPQHSGAQEDKPKRVPGALAGQPEAAKAGLEMLAAGANAVDAAVTAALVACTVAIQQCGIGGYGGHMMIASADGSKVTAIDFNSAAPAAAREDMFPLDDKGAVKGGVNGHGWLAAGVPGILAGLQLALDRHGTLPFKKLVQPAIRYAREGFPLPEGVIAALRGVRPHLLKDAASARLLLENSELPKAGTVHRNPQLADLLEKLAEQNSVEAFYRGDIARQVAAAFKCHGGLVTAEDLASYRAREVEPLELCWNGFSIRTAPLTAGGLTVLQALAMLKALAWEKLPRDEPRELHARLECLRVAWDDRLKLFGDPEKSKVLIERLLSEEYAKERAAQVRKVVEERKLLPAATDGRAADGTIHLSVVDAKGNMVAVTLTHGGSFGAAVTVEGLGLVLGHGMSRFDPQPGRPNSPGPGKRPLHNMCPTIVLKHGRPLLAIGARGGRKIPNAVFEVLAQLVGRGENLQQAVAAQRLHTEGGAQVSLEPRAVAAHESYLKELGYKVDRGGSAVVSAVQFDPASAAESFRALSR